MLGRLLRGNLHIDRIDKHINNDWVCFKLSVYSTQLLKYSGSINQINNEVSSINFNFISHFYPQDTQSFFEIKTSNQSF